MRRRFKAGAYTLRLVTYSSCTCRKHLYPHYPWSCVLVLHDADAARTGDSSEHQGEVEGLDSQFAMYNNIDNSHHSHHSHHSHCPVMVEYSDEALFGLGGLTGCAAQPGFRLRPTFRPSWPLVSTTPVTIPIKKAKVMPPTQVVSRKRTASEANLTGSEERAPKRHQTNNPRPLARPHHIKRFTPPPPKIKERPNLFSRAFSRVKDFWNRASTSLCASLCQTALSSLTSPLLARCNRPLHACAI